MATLAAHLRDDHHKDIQHGPIRTPGTLRFEDRTWSIGGEYRLPVVERLELAVALSHDARDSREAQDQNRAGTSFTLDDQSATNYQAQLVWRHDDAGALRLSAARRGRFPSEFERYSYRLGSALPNPDLQLERATTVELGYARTMDRYRVDAAVFHSRLTDLIQPVTVSPGVTQNQNVGAARYTGFELGLSASPLPILTAGVNYTYMNRASRSEPKRILFGVPRHSAFIWTEWRPIEALEVVPSVSINAKRLTSDIAAASGEPVGGYTTIDLRVAYRFMEHYRVELVGHNLADKLYALDYGFPREGRSVGLVLRGDF